jgi:hypothetical protein
MATKGAAAKTAAKKETGGALVKWDERLAEKARAAKKVAAQVGGGGGDFLSFKGGKISFQGATVPGGAMDVAVLSAVAENNFFEGGYDPNNPQAPLCYAFGSPDGDDEEMAPHPAVVKAGNNQAETCAECEHNKWGSAEKGRGKACKNVVKLSLITADELEKGADAVRKAKPFYAKVPVTSGRNWAGYVNSLGDKHFLGFVTTMSVVPKGETYEVLFEAKEEVRDGEVLGALVEKSDVEDKNMAREYPKFDDAPPARQPARRVVPIKKGGAAVPAKPAAKKAAKY